MDKSLLFVSQIGKETIEVVGKPEKQGTMIQEKTAPEINCNEIQDTETTLIEKLDVKITGAKIGDNLICNIKAEAVKTKKTTKIENRTAVLVLDCSGSMGQWVQRSVNAWQGALRALNFSEDDTVHMIEFDSRTKMSQHQLKNLGTLNLRARGCTSMSGVVPMLETILKRYNETTINIWVISDGQIDDQRHFKQTMTETLEPHLNSPNITVVGVRLCSSHSDPDVQAMSAVGLLSTQEFKLEDFNNSGYEERTDTSSLKELLSGMKTPENKLLVAMKEPKLLVRPGEEEKMTLELWNQDWFLVKGGKEGTTVTVNDVPTAVEMLPEDENLGVLEQFATKVYLRLVQEKVAGLYDNTKFIEALQTLFDDLDDMTKRIEEAHSAQTSDMTTTSRAKQIQRKFVKQKVTIRQKIAELKNMGNMERMTGHMQSDLMRNLGSTKSDVGLMRRFAKTDHGKDPAQMMHDAIEKCKLATTQLKLEKDMDVREECFLSKETSLESALAAIDTAVNVYEQSSEIKPDDLLTVFGLHGIALRHKVANYTDPMLIGLNQGLKDTISEVYPNVILNQSVVWFAQQSGSQLKAPGFDRPITAVVPVKAWNHPAVWKLYCQDSDIAAMQTSAHLRNVLTPLPKDRVAFTASTLLKMMADWSDPSEIQRKMMCDVLSTLQWKQQSDASKKLADTLMGDNPLSALSTENNLASALAPFAQIFCDTSLLTFLGGPNSQKLWQALVANTVYWTVRRAIGDDDRTEVINNLINFKEENFTHPLGDLEDEPANVNIHNSWDIKTVTEFITKNKYLHNNKLYMNLLELAKKFTAAGNKITPEIFTSVQNKAKMDPMTVGMDFDIFCHVEIVKSIHTRNETERYNEESIGFHKTEEEASAFLRSTVEDLYRKQYDTELKEKLDRVKEAKLQNFLETFTTMKFDQFTKKMHENVPNQSSKGMSEMIGKLGSDKEGIVDKVKKVELLLTGRLGEITWNNGSVSR